MKVVTDPSTDRRWYSTNVSRIRFEFNGQEFEIKEDKARNSLVLMGDEPLMLKPIASNALSFEFQEWEVD